MTPTELALHKLAAQAISLSAEKLAFGRLKEHKLERYKPPSRGRKPPSLDEIHERSIYKFIEAYWETGRKHGEFNLMPWILQVGHYDRDIGKPRASLLQSLEEQYYAIHAQARYRGTSHERLLFADKILQIVAKLEEFLTPRGKLRRRLEVLFRDLKRARQYHDPLEPIQAEIDAIQEQMRDTSPYHDYFTDEPALINELLILHERIITASVQNYLTAKYKDQAQKEAGFIDETLSYIRNIINRY